MKKKLIESEHFIQYDGHSAVAVKHQRGMQALHNSPLPSQSVYHFHSHSHSLSRSLDRFDRLMIYEFSVSFPSFQVSSPTISTFLTSPLSSSSIFTNCVIIFSTASQISKDAVFAFLFLLSLCFSFCYCFVSI